MTCVPSPPAPTIAADAFRMRCWPSAPKNRSFRSNRFMVRLKTSRKAPAGGRQTPASYLERDQWLSDVGALNPRKPVDTVRRDHERRIGAMFQAPPDVRYKVGETRTIARREFGGIAEWVGMHLD